MDRRREPRFECKQNACITLLDGSPVPLEGTLVNISADGARLTVGEPLPINVPVRVDVGETLLLGDVCYCQPEAEGYSVGIALAHAVVEATSLNALLTNLENPQPETPWTSQLMGR